MVDVFQSQIELYVTVSVVFIMACTPTDAIFDDPNAHISRKSELTEL